MERFAEDATLLQWLREYLLDARRGGIERSSRARRRRARSSPIISTMPKPIDTIPSHRALALLRGRREGMLNVALRLDSEAEKPKWDAPHNPCEGAHRRAFRHP